ncbi:MAG: ABC transporter substrate-binding protein [Cytophagales bacterium]|nr:ABC transporter substrate-binding protein [Cytophagales bacterium]
MSQLRTLNVGGVPEHFNLPWHLALEGGTFAERGLDLRWQDYPGGTGAMNRDLRSGTLDVAVLLTEGIVADICKGNPSVIIAPYVVSPLIWGIHVPALSGFQTVAELEGKRFAISRYGSGSHLMAFVHAQQLGWHPEALELVLVGDLNGAREAFRQGAADAFMWEKAMTQPLVDKGEFRRVGECPTPWPSFVIAARRETLESRRDDLQQMLAVIGRAARAFKQNPDAIRMVSDRYGIKPEDVAAWFVHTRWAGLTGEDLTENVLQHVMQTLLDLRLIDEPVHVNALMHKL